MRALLVIDMQNDFMPTGKIPVQNADTLIYPINEKMKEYTDIIVTQDWHPPDHISFASRHEKPIGTVIKTPFGEQRLWPDHCLAHSNGAAIVANLNTSLIDTSIKKGSHKDKESYSAFFDTGMHSTGLQEYLYKKGVDAIDVCGVALEYCVLWSAIDAIRLGFTTRIILPLVKAAHPGEKEEAIALAELDRAGVRIITV